MAISVGEHNIALDSHDPESNVNFVSHAHMDHTSGIRKSKKTIASEATKDLIEIRTNLTVDLLDEPEGVTLLNAGHILGSKQLHVENRVYGYSMIYSGDYQISEPIMSEKMEVKEADVLIIDSTYPEPELKFEDRNEAITAIQHYIKMKIDRGNVIFGSRVIGRAQELIKIMNEIGVAPVVDEKISKINKIYHKHGFDFKYSEQTIGYAGMRGNFVAVVDQSKLNETAQSIRIKTGGRVFTAVASGLAKMFRFNADVQFELSDHADFSQAVDYINMTNPKIVLTFGPNAKLMAKNLAMKGYNAKPLEYTSALNCAMLNYI